MTLAVRNPIARLSNMLRAAAAAAALAGFFLAASPFPASAADEATGKALALQWCSSCHLVSDDQATASSVSLPSFYDMARDPDWSQEKLATFLANPHPKMPDMNLGNTEIVNLSAYISSLAP